MKDKNIKFNKAYTEERAVAFLKGQSYYKKITSYQNNFQYSMVNGTKKYMDLDFSYLVELSTLDMEFRFLIIRMCLNIEYAAKVYIINKCIENEEDGYSIVEEYFLYQSNNKKNVKGKILKNANNSYCMDLVVENQNRMPLWVLLEVVSFGDLCHLYKFVRQKGYVTSEEVDLLFHVRNFRNAAAHNHCLFSQLKSQDEKSLPIVSQYVAKIESITKSERKSRLSSKCINDFVTLLVAFEYYIKSNGIMKHTKEDIRNLFFDRMLLHKDYFKHCNTVKNAYIFANKILDIWLA